MKSHYFIAAFALLLSLSLAMAQENNTQTPQPETQPSSQNLCPSAIAPKVQGCTDGSSVSCQPSCDSATGAISECAMPSCPEAQSSSSGSSSSPSNDTSGSSGTATSPSPSPASISQPSPMPACAPVTTLAADDAGNCRQFSDSCLPPGWRPVDKCPERRPVISPEQMPQGCREIRDETGFVKVVCEAKPMECPQYSDEEIKRCESGNGKPNFFMDHRGCKIFECRFQQEAGGFMQPVKCPSEEERQLISEKCKSNNMSPVIRRDYNGCKYMECVSGHEGGATPEKWEGMRSGACANVQKEDFDKCRNEGGEMIVKEDRGCITYAKCVMRGNERNVEYEEVEEMPQSSILLSLAFKLEQLKIEFDKLAKQTDDIANYYASNGDKSSEERFRKVSSMFTGAKQKIDEIKTKMRSHISSLTKEDIADFKHDIKYIKEVVIQDILYVMLSTEGATSISASSQHTEGCGDDGWCFNKALRTCEKTTFYPEGRSGPEIIIDGLEDKNCIIKASISTPVGRKEMTCKYPNYVMGMERSDDLLPYCKGEMAEMAKQYGSEKPMVEKRPSKDFGTERTSDRQLERNIPFEPEASSEGMAAPQRAIEQAPVEPQAIPFEPQAAPGIR